MRRSMILVFGNRSRHQEMENLAQQSLSLSLSLRNRTKYYFYEILEIFPSLNVRFKLYVVRLRSSNFNNLSEELAKNWQT